MKVVKGKSFEDAEGKWNKVEVEVDAEDLPESAKEADGKVKYWLLDNRAEFYLLFSLWSSKAITDDDYSIKREALEKVYIAQLKSLKPKVKLIRRDKKHEPAE